MRVQFLYVDEKGIRKVSEIDATEQETILLSNSTHVVFPDYFSTGSFVRKKGRVISKTLYTIPNDKIFAIEVDEIEDSIAAP